MLNLLTYDKKNYIEIYYWNICKIKHFNPLNFKFFFKIKPCQKSFSYQFFRNIHLHYTNNWNNHICFVYFSKNKFYCGKDFPLNKRSI